VDRDVLIAIARVKYRAGTARSTLPDVQNLLVIGIIPDTKSFLAFQHQWWGRLAQPTARLNLQSIGPVAAATGPYRARGLLNSKSFWELVSTLASKTL